ncbi:Pentatricopeptide repeat-containing protein [Acorus gramineus]|uniref:Pentatricopeptide repeat-containing protein n=1 Tax=Acorus gramineus TaxID=55184 RepID=A0AAV9B717_ACOGR|nr:Pentatricopeptide repeat-containing protein [Acorus gramineus]
MLRLLLNHLPRPSVHLSLSRSRHTVRVLPSLSTPPISLSDLSSISSRSDLLSSFTVTPPLDPWPSSLPPSRLAFLIRRQRDPSLALRVFLHASDFHSPSPYPHTPLTTHSILSKLSRARAFHLLELLLARLKLSRAAAPLSEASFVDVIRAYGLAGRPDSALEVFSDMKDGFGLGPTVRSFNALLHAMVQNRRFRLARDLFFDSKEKFGVAPNVITCNVLISALCENGELGSAEKVIDKMPEWGLAPDVVTYTTLVCGYCRRGDLEKAREVFEEMVRQGWVPDETAYTVMIDGYCRHGRVLDAVRFMDRMESDDRILPNEVTYGVVIEAYCREGKPGEALSLMEEMLSGKYMPDAPQCFKVIDLLCRVGRVDEACELWEKLLKKNCVPDNAITSTLVYWLCKAGKVWEARKIFKEFEKGFVPSSLTYSTLISGLCECGELQEAGSLWDEMVEKGWAPSTFTYNALMKAFVKSGSVGDGIRLFEEMLEKGCMPDRSTFATLVDGIYRSGKEDEVDRVVKMAVSSSKAVLLSEACWGVFVSKAIHDTGRSRIEIEKCWTDLSEDFLTWSSYHH